MSHRDDCPSRWESERQARRDAEDGYRNYGYGNGCDEAAEDYRRAYLREEMRLEEQREEERAEQRRLEMQRQHREEMEQRQREDEERQQEEEYAYQQEQERQEAEIKAATIESELPTKMEEMM